MSVLLAAIASGIKRIKKPTGFMGYDPDTTNISIQRVLLIFFIYFSYKDIPQKLIKQLDYLSNMSEM